MRRLREVLEERIHVDVTVFDSCAKDPNAACICQLLYEGHRGLSYLSSEMLYERREMLHDILTFFTCHPLVIIDETWIEINEYLELLNNRYRCIKSYLEKQTTTWRKSTDLEEREYEFSMLAELRTYVDDIYRFVKCTKNCDVRNSFSSEQQQLYTHYLNLAVDERAKMDKQKLRKEIYLKKPRLTGEHLQTDNKLIATAFTLAHTTPATLLTRDQGIIEQARRIYEHLYNGTAKNYGLEKEPPNFLSCWSPENARSYVL